MTYPSSDLNGWAGFLDDEEEESMQKTVSTFTVNFSDLHLEFNPQVVTSWPEVVEHANIKFTFSCMRLNRKLQMIGVTYESALGYLLKIDL